MESPRGLVKREINRKEKRKKKKESQGGWRVIQDRDEMGSEEEGEKWKITAIPMKLKPPPTPPSNNSRDPVSFRNLVYSYRGLCLEEADAVSRV